ncbi:hypothetical protein [Bradyrhizobium sp.]|uniref:hypothetical protein n=1 Tax=Bradyrhizobium sp. TaxID=376 RepID=UPI002DDD88B6|nr:hypothetical protein [Bradyrhizobium sp.]HEV2155426.1 hypothetical protein [Bradyrhizobium sp.]
MTAFDAQLRKVKALEEKLAGWSNKLNDPRKFKPVMQIEWGRCFDAREKAKTELCRMDRERFAVVYPNEPNDR